MAGEQLHVAQRPACLVHEPCRARNERAPSGVGRTAFQADRGICPVEPDDDADAVIGLSAQLAPIRRNQRRQSMSAARNVGWIGMRRPLRFLAMLSCSSMTLPTRP